jgi:hypothetical protein
MPPPLSRCLGEECGWWMDRGGLLQLQQLVNDDADADDDAAERP